MEKEQRRMAAEEILRGELESLVRSTAELRQRLEADVDILQEEIGALKGSVGHPREHERISADVDEKLAGLENKLFSKLLDVARPLRASVKRISEEIEALSTRAKPQPPVDIEAVVEQKVTARLEDMKRESQNISDIQAEINMLVKNKLQQLEASATSAQTRELEDVKELRNTLKSLKEDNSGLRAEVKELRKSRLEELKNAYKKVPVVVQ